MAARDPGSRSNYYEILGLSPSASDDEIRKKYLEIVRTLHPDRRHTDDMDRFHQVQASWRCLSDPTKRMLYDLRNFGESILGASSPGGNCEESLMLRQKEQAECCLRNMEVELQGILQREGAKHGLLVQEALYGNLQLREELLHEALKRDRQIRAADLQGPWIEVTRAVQCLVEKHSIVVHGSASSSKADLPGFYNPTPLNSDYELSLYVLYTFKDKLHEVIVDDRESLQLPLRKHLVEGAHPRGPFPSSNVELLMRRRQLSAEASEKQGDKLSRRRRILSPEQALARAVRRHLFLRLQGGQDVSRHEFRLIFVMAATAGLALAWAHRAWAESLLAYFDRKLGRS